MTQADDTTTRWVSLAKVLSQYARIYGEAVAKRDLPALLGAGKVSWRGEKRGQGPLDVGDPRAFRRGDSTDALLAVSWAEGRVIRGTAPQRIVVRPGETAYRQAPHRYEFVRIEIALDELIARMPEDVRAKMEPRGLGVIRDLSSRKSAAQETPQKKRRGPKKGSIARYAESDRKHFPIIRKLMGDGATLNEAVKSLAGKLSGIGTKSSRAARLAKLFSEENDAS
jgi:hypothetical protein